jgi:DNA-directed RNA polymerase subunit RPC12/RpoP
VVAAVVIIAATLIVAWAFGADLWKAGLAVLVAAVILRLGYAVISGLAQPVPEPPAEGELRKVKLTYRCMICGAEVRMTAAPSEDPEPPRHCQEDMQLLTPIEDL